MAQLSRSTGLGLLLGVSGTVLVMVAVALAVAYTGAYNVAATENHLSLTRWAFQTTLHSSVKRRADAVTSPERFTTEMITTGATHYRTTCQYCHAGPGVERAEWASGMRPRPPHLVAAAAEWEPEEIFWLAKHGIKMTGMPAFGPTHDDETLWAIAAFVKQLPAMTPEEYAEITNRGDAQYGETQADHGG